MTSLEQHVHDALVGSGWTKGQPVVVGASGGLDFDGAFARPEFAWRSLRGRPCEPPRPGGSEPR